MMMWEQMNKQQWTNFNDSSNWVGEVLPALTGTKEKCALAESNSSVGDYPSILTPYVDYLQFSHVGSIPYQSSFVTPINTSTIPNCNDKPKEYTVKLQFFIFWICFPWFYACFYKTSQTFHNNVKFSWNTHLCFPPSSAINSSNWA